MCGCQRYFLFQTGYQAKISKILGIQYVVARGALTNISKFLSRCQKDKKRKHQKRKAGRLGSVKKGFLIAKETSWRKPIVDCTVVVDSCESWPRRCVFGIGIVHTLATCQQLFSNTSKGYTAIYGRLKTKSWPSAVVGPVV